MKLFYEWGISSIGLLIWTGLTLVAVRAVVRYQKKRVPRIEWKRFS